MNNKDLYNEKTNIPASEFELVHNNENIHDTKFETRPIGWFEDSVRRFAKNPASVIGFILITILTLFSIIVPIVSPYNNYDTKKFIEFKDGFRVSELQECAPKLFSYNGGFWDGTELRELNVDDFSIKSNNDGNRPYYQGKAVLKKIIKEDEKTGIKSEQQLYVIHHDTYAIGTREVQIRDTQLLQKIKDYEVKKNIVFSAENMHKSVLKPQIDYLSYLNGEVKDYLNSIGADTTTVIDDIKTYYIQNPGVYYKIMPEKRGTNTFYKNRFQIVYDDQGKIQDLYLKDTNGDYVYESILGDSKYRVDYNSYFKLKYGNDFQFIFGATKEGQDLFTRLAEGGRFSLLLGVGISLINFIIGLIWGAISGYYGGTVDLVMERITDVIANVPTIIVLSLCSIQFTSNIALKEKLGSGGLLILAFLVAFIFNGWVGVAGTTRMQFYRFKGQEYVLASRTLGAKDRRLIFKHILPNAAGTLVTRCVLMIPGIIFAESSLSYLGIISFSGSGLASIGDILESGQGDLASNPYRVLFPALIISVLMISYNLFGNGLRDAFNTTLRGSED